MKHSKLSAANDMLLLLAIRIICLGLVGYWSLILIRPTAVLFTLYMVPVNLLDNILRPLAAKSLSTPMPVILIGVLGGT